MKSRFDTDERGRSPAWENVTRSLMGALQIDLLTEKLQGLNLDIQVRTLVTST